MKSQHDSHGLLWVVVLVLSCGCFFEPLRLSKINYSLSSAYFYVALTLLGLIGAWATISFRRNLVAGFGFALVLFFLVVLSNTCLVGGEAKTIIGNLLRCFLVLGFFSAGKSILTLNFSLRLKIVSLLPGLIGVATIYYLFFRGGSVYFGYSAELSLVAVASGGWLGILAVITILLSGKRGLILAMAVGWLFNVRRFAGWGFVAVFSFLMAFTCCRGFWVESFERLILRSGGGDGFDLNAISSGRLAEITGVIGLFNDPLFFLFGGGLGFFYESATGLGIDSLHFSPLAVACIGGVPFALFVYGSICYLLIRRVKHHGCDYVVSLTIMYLVYSVFVFSIFQNAILWLLVGFLSRRNLIHRNSY